MNARRLAAHSPRAVRDALLRHGWDAVKADAAAGSLDPVVVLLEDLAPETIEALVRHNRQLGLDLLTGEGWVLLAGSRSRLGVFARPWTLPSELVDLGTAVGQALPADPPEQWHTARFPIRLDHPILFGILNVTPDSFSDGGSFADIDLALAHAARLVESGADIIDVGGESTRPGAEPVSAERELARVIPVVSALVREHPTLPISVDTVKAVVAEAALDAGVTIVNDVSGLRLDPAMGSVVARHRAGLVVMHSRGGVHEMARTELGEYGPDPVGVIIGELGRALKQALALGVASEAVVLDPGLGFAKTAEQSLLVLDQLASFVALGHPVMVGPSRKRFLGVAPGRPVADRDRATAAACVVAYQRGARLFRVHDVAIARAALALAAAVQGP
ncbi:MAG TPA: dihydropteroate synthase [Gemmatimonadales bacterium]|nr:dihydropteroate synthase [Gemmatimonadales bacterium]